MHMFEMEFQALSDSAVQCNLEPEGTVIVHLPLNLPTLF
jgi:hypothetical protein